MCSLLLVAACDTAQVQQPQPRPALAKQPSMVTPASAGKVLSTPSGMTLYTYDKDVASQSNCYAECARYWLPFLGDFVSGSAGPLSLIARNDGAMQWAESGKPLYTFVQDRRPGDAKGDDFQNIWHVVR